MSSGSDSIPLSDADALLLKRFGRDIIQDTVGIVTEAIACSAYGIFFALALYSILRKGLKSRGAIVMLVAMVYLYTSSLAAFALDIVLWVKRTQALLMTVDTPLLDRAALASQPIVFILISEVISFMLSMIIGDSIVLWRAWIVCRGKIWVLCVPGVMLLMTFIFGVTDIACQLVELQTLDEPSGVCTHPDILMWAFSAATNVACTIIIGVKAFQHRKLMRVFDIPGKARTLTTEKILSILVESGFIYSLFFLTPVIAYTGLTRDSPWWYLNEIIVYGSGQIVGMYPTLIIVIVNFHRTIWDDELPRASNSAALNTLRFARSTPADTLGVEQEVPAGLEAGVVDTKNGILMHTMVFKEPATQDV
ncbi:hypothetical protein C8F04DRAFT_1250295 [Mycena alexandri]|uniref:Uncharacterized protein n=1 Tax=Mycena alexandri TaxID=1745969 RepID=A0AAD6TI72_9AGAR|nr:hypothetical protein C8F04DRAFT_1250295 [Mycena alexandri]